MTITLFVPLSPVRLVLLKAIKEMNEAGAQRVDFICHDNYFELTQKTPDGLFCLRLRLKKYSILGTDAHDVCRFVYKLADEIKEKTNALTPKR